MVELEGVEERSEGPEVEDANGEAHGAQKIFFSGT